MPAAHSVEQISCPAFERPLPLSETVALPPNAGGQTWHVVLSQPGTFGTNQELVPAGQTEKTWTEMITVRGFPPGTDVPKLVTQEVQLFANVCKSHKIIEAHQGVGRAIPAKVSGPRYNYAKFDVLAECDDPKRTDTGLKAHEVIWFKGLHGQRANYLVQRAWHANAAGPDTILGATNVHNEWHAWIDGVGLNADVAGPAK
jgi:hypothetical protein